MSKGEELEQSTRKLIEQTPGYRTKAKHMRMKRHDFNVVSVLPGSMPELDTARGPTISCHDVHTESARVDDLVKLALAKERQVSDPKGLFKLRIVGCRTC